jgi:catechol 2,3-dioxygenase-like lactoylglutathione lyase family enzyme
VTRQSKAARTGREAKGHATPDVQVYGVNHVAIEVDDAEKAVAFYSDVFNLKMLRGGEGAAWCQLGAHQFLAILEVDRLRPDRAKHFGLMLRDDEQVQAVRRKLTTRYGLELEPGFRCDFRDPWGNRIQVGDLHDESLVWLLPYQEVQALGIRFEAQPAGRPKDGAGQGNRVAHRRRRSAR